MLAAVAVRTNWMERLLLAMSLRLEEERESLSAPARAYIDSLRRGDPDSWRTLFDEESPAIYRYAFSRLGNSHDAEDVTNQVFEEAWKSIARYRDQGLPLRAWLFGIARNLVGSHRRRFMSRNPQVSVDGLQIEGPPEAVQADMLDLVDAIASLERSQAETISLRYIHGLSLAETAAVLGTTVDGVKGRQQRALAALKQRLRRD
jgi:RNA polymerase sigma-70 factor (ECF subfamily)